MILLEIAVAAPVDKLLTYELPDSPLCVSPNKTSPDKKQSHSYIGRRVLVPLGKRLVTGYVLSLASADESRDFKLRKVKRILDDEPVFHEKMVEFFLWIADYYHYPPGLVIKSGLPAGFSTSSRKKLVLEKDCKLLLEHIGSNEIPAWVKKLESQKTLSYSHTKKLLSERKNTKLVTKLLAEEILSLKNEIQTDSVASKLEICFTPSYETVTPEANQQTLLQFEDSVSECTKYIADRCDIALKPSEIKALLILNKMAFGKSDPVALKDIRKLYPNSSKPLKSLVAKGFVKRTEKRVYRSPLGVPLTQLPEVEVLTNEQEAVLKTLLPAITNKTYTPFLLHGVTGSGKTEVYLRAAEETIKQGRDVIILVPEIGLATQLETHLLARFKDRVALYHSGLSAAQRFDQYYLALTGRAKIVVGARSAIFAPLRDPGLIIVDEEHETSFKQDDSLRYHGRDLAVVRAKMNNAVVLLGSATPSVTSYYHASVQKYILLQMTKRVGERSLPSVTVVDLSKEQSKSKKKNTTIISDLLLEKLINTLENQKQTVLLLNRRGFSNALLCRNCGTPVTCNHCSVSLTLHLEQNKLLCHYCGYAVHPKVICSQCRSTDLGPVGFGIERVEEELKHLLPKARVARLDSDIGANRKKFLTILQKMHEGSVDLLLGTQMIAKGHHFPNVTLVGVIWADGGMSMPDFRASERTFQLLTQVTGRAGRGDSAGEVIIQTLRPDHYSIRYSQQQNYEAFFEHELKMRKNPTFPPFTRLGLLRIDGRVEKRVIDSSLTIAKYCRQRSKVDGLAIDVLGPAPAPIDKVKDKYRFQILLKCTRSEKLNYLCSNIRGKSKELLAAGCHLTIDIDPENMM